MRTYFNNGALIAFSNALVTLVLYMGGFQTDPAKFNTGSYLSFSLNLLLTLIVVVRVVRARRILTPPTDEFPFGLVMGIAVIITLFSSILSAVFQFLYLSFINTSFTGLVVETKLAAMHPALNPAVYVGIEFIVSIVFNVIISLIIAAIMRRKAVEETPLSPPPL